jgi:hypothetical protein
VASGLLTATSEAAHPPYAAPTDGSLHAKNGVNGGNDYTSHTSTITQATFNSSADVQAPFNSSADGPPNIISAAIQATCNYFEALASDFRQQKSLARLPPLLEEAPLASPSPQT